MVTLDICSTRKAIVLTGLSVITAMLILMVHIVFRTHKAIMCRKYKFSGSVVGSFKRHIALGDSSNVSRAKVEVSFYCNRIRIFMSSYGRVM